MPPEIDVPIGGDSTEGEDEMAQPVTDSFGEVVARSQALTVDVVGKGFASSSTRRDIIADRKFDELDIEQSMANRYGMTGQPGGTP